jgi:hypothetical protein
MAGDSNSRSAARVAGGVVEGTPLAEGRILEGELGRGSESRAEGGEQAEKDGEHGGWRTMPS